MRAAVVEDREGDGCARGLVVHRLVEREILDRGLDRDGGVVEESLLIRLD